MERSEHIAEWIRLTEKKVAQVAPLTESPSVEKAAPLYHKGRGRKGGVRDAAREIGVERTEAQRAIKIDSITPEAKQACREAGLDENLMRHELSSAERSQQTARRKELYEALHPETAHAAFKGNQHQSGSRQNGDKQPDRFTKATAAATGQSERSVQRDAYRHLIGVYCRRSG